jgi:hypothetical protein
VAHAAFQNWRIILDAQEAVKRVTAEDVQRVARATFRKNRQIVATLVKPEMEFDPAKEEEGKKTLDRMIAALGGKKKVGAIRTLQVESTVALRTPAGSMTGQSKNAYALPDKMFAEVTLFGQTMKQCASPSGMWRVRQGALVEVTGEEAEEMRADLERDLFLLCAPELQKGYLIQAREEEDGKATLEVRGASGKTFRVTMASRTGLPESVAYDGEHPMTGAPAKFVETFADYRAVKGVLRPHRIVTTVDGEPFAESTVTRLTINSEVSAELFEKPSG